MKCLLAFVSTVLIGAASAQHAVDYLPGYPGTGKIPFTMETGYIGVGDMDEVQLFYYFIESERDPSADPLMLWLTGGPGCSGFSPLAFQIGPMIFDYDGYNGSLPTWRHAKHSWTKAASIIFIDQPVGAGFSYSTTTQGNYSDDKKAAFDAYTFLRKWLLKHPQFLGNQLYIGGDSYSGMIVPLVVNNILIGLENGDRPRMDLQGYVLGNPVTDNYIDPNSRIPYVHRVNLISDKYYQDAVTYCGGDYVNIDANNTLCIATMEKIKQCLLQINLAQILEPQCAFASKKTEELEFPFKGPEAEYIEHLLSDDKLPVMRCRGFTYVLAYKWLNDARVRRALNVQEGTNANWHRCWKTFSNFTEEVTSTIPYHKNFTNMGMRALIYSGDHDISVPYLSTMTWIKSLGLSVFDEWRPWYVDGQIAGYQVKYMNDNYRLTYVTLKGAGHTGPEYKSKEALAMFDRHKTQSLASTIDLAPAAAKNAVPPQHHPLKSPNPNEPDPTRSAPLTPREKGSGLRAWLSLDSAGQSQVVEAGKHAIMRRTGLPARDLRILGPLLLCPSTSLDREKAIVINLEHIKTIVTAHEVLLLNSRDPSGTPFVDELQCRLAPQYNAVAGAQEGIRNESNWTNLYNMEDQSRPVSPECLERGFPQVDAVEEENKADRKPVSDNRDRMKFPPFEFIALEAACTCLENEARTLE